MAICELKPCQFCSVEPLICDPLDQPEAMSIVHGINPGLIFADDGESPAAALIWAKGIEGFYLVGDVDSIEFRRNLRAYIAEVISPRARREGMDWFEVSGDDPRWDTVIREIFGTDGSNESSQCVYRAVSVQPTGDDQPLDPRIIELDHDVIRTLHSGFAERKIERFWRDLPSFLENGAGYAAVINGEIVALCMSAFVAGPVHVLDIETAERHRRQGLAKCTARRFIDRCRDEGWQTYWDCMAENAASRAVAESIGLALRKTYTLHSLPMP